MKNNEKQTEAEQGLASPTCSTYYERVLTGIRWNIRPRIVKNVLKKAVKETFGLLSVGLVGIFSSIAGIVLIPFVVIRHIIEPFYIPIIHHDLKYWDKFQRKKIK